MDNRQRIQDALVQLQSRTNDDAYTIVEHRKTGKFLQFAGGLDRPLVLDLPSHGLDASKLKRVRALWQTLATEGYQVRSSGSPEIFQVDLGDDINAAAALAMRVMTEVHQSPEDFPLSVEEN